MWPFEYKYVWCCLGGQQHSIFTCGNLKVIIRKDIYEKNLMWNYQVENHTTNYAKPSPLPTSISSLEYIWVFTWNEWYFALLNSSNFMSNIWEKFSHNEIMKFRSILKGYLNVQCITLVPWLVPHRVKWKCWAF